MSGLTRAFRRASIPLAAYYAVTLAIPLANGAAQSNAVFFTHALAVLVIPPVIILLACAAHAAAHVLARGYGVVRMARYSPSPPAAAVKLPRN